MPIHAEAERWQALERVGHSVMNLDGTEPVIDLYTDVCPRSFVEEIVDVGCRVSREGSAEPRIQELAETLYGPAHYVTTANGRSAEQALVAAFQFDSGIVLTHGLFPTTQKAFADAGMTTENVPLLTDGRSDIDTDWLGRRLGAGGVTAVCLEPCSNSNSGWLLSLENCEAVSSLCKRHDVLFFLDAARVLTNFMGEGGLDRDAVRRATGLADAYTIPVSKELLVPYGGLIAVRDMAIYGRAFMHTFIRGTTCEPLSLRAMLAAGMQRMIDSDDLLVERRQRIERLRAGLSAQGVPQVEPASGHAVFVPLDSALVDGGGSERYRAIEALLFAVTGMRNLIKPSPSLGCPVIRLPVPLARYSDEELATVPGSMRGFFDRLHELPRLVPRPGGKNFHPYLAEYDIERA